MQSFRCRYTIKSSTLSIIPFLMMLSMSDLDFKLRGDVLCKLAELYVSNVTE